MLSNQSIVYQTREEYVAAQLRRLITDGHIAPGEEIDQSSLAEQLGVSRSPVRDALRRVAAEALLGINPHKQAFVPRLTPDEVAEIYRILAWLEGLAALLAVPKMRAADLQALRALHQQMEGDVTPDEWVAVNLRFHSTLCELADSPCLVNIIDNLRALRQVASRYARDYVTRPENRKPCPAISACCRPANSGIPRLPSWRVRGTCSRPGRTSRAFSGTGARAQRSPMAKLRSSLAERHSGLPAGRNWSSLQHKEELFSWI